MVHRYYHCLRPWQQRVYRQSNEVTAIPLRVPGGLRAPLVAVDRALAAGDPRLLARAAAELVAKLCRQLRVAAPAVTVLAERPAGHWGELHGLYHPDQGTRGTITVWMRTARLGRVVAFRTLLRTLLHELCHHLDLGLLGLPCSFHTTGFRKRESHLFRQLQSVRELAAPAAPAGRGESSRRKSSPRVFRRGDSPRPAGVAAT